MISLALVRHAEAAHPDPALDDHDRPLDERGVRDAPTMAARLADRGFVPERILASTALRARTTAEFFATAFDTAIELEERLYGAPAQVILDAARTSGASSLLVVAHDPGMSAAVEQISGGEWSRMPTCAVALFSWRVEDWETALATAPDTRSLDAPR